MLENVSGECAGGWVARFWDHSKSILGKSVFRRFMLVSGFGKSKVVLISR